MSIARHLTLEQSLRRLALSFHLRQRCPEKATQCVHRPQVREESNHAGKSVRLAVWPLGPVDPGIPVPRHVDRFHHAYAGLIFQELQQAREEFPEPFGNCSPDYPEGRIARLRM